MYPFSSSLGTYCVLRHCIRHLAHSWGLKMFLKAQLNIIVNSRDTDTTKTFHFFSIVDDTQVPH